MHVFINCTSVAKCGDLEQEPVKHTISAAAVTPTGRKSVRNRCVIEGFSDIIALL